MTGVRLSVDVVLDRAAKDDRKTRAGLIREWIVEQLKGGGT